MAGFIKLARGYRDMTVLHDPRPWRRPDAWTWMLEQASYAGPDQGQLSVKVAALAKTWTWSRQAVYRFLQNLESANEIKLLAAVFPDHKNRTNSGQPPDNERTYTERGTFAVTICNYGQYSVPDTSRKQVSGQPPDNERTTPGLSYIESKKEESKKEEKEEGTHAMRESRPPPRQGSLLEGGEVVPFKATDEQQAFDAYNAMAVRCDLPVARSFGPSRRGHMRQRLKELGGLDGWMIALGKVEESAFIRAWRTDGWSNFGIASLLREQTLAKLMDDTYRTKRGDKETVWAQERREYLESGGQGSLYRG